MVLAIAPHPARKKSRHRIQKKCQHVNGVIESMLICMGCLSQGSRKSNPNLNSVFLGENSRCASIKGSLINTVACKKTGCSYIND